MRFLFNQHKEPIDLGEVNPNMTVLQWLRRNKHTGTKEGCAAGDCGACTAVIGELATIKGKKVIEYKSINTCISLVLNLNGKHLITVEGISEGNRLHPVQSAMVRTNGSQCGFCTPGFVMSLFALYHNENEIDLDKINEALSGNLCRCTGYQPIIDAAFLIFETKDSDNNDYFSKNKSQLVQSLVGINEDEPEQFSYTSNDKKVTYDAPTDVNVLAKTLYKYQDAKIVSGCTDLGLEITQQLQQFGHIINVQNVHELKSIHENDSLIEIGAAVSYHSAWALLVRSFPELEPLLKRFASRPIRNWATIGGNIANASPIGDMPPALIALNATLKLRRGDNVREVRLQDFFISYKKTVLLKGEFIKSITIPKLVKGESFTVHKISRRYEDDISAVCMAIKLVNDGPNLKEAVIALGGMAEIPKRATMLEKTVTKYWNKRDIAKRSYESLKEDFCPLDDVRASSEYRLQVSANLIKKTLLNRINEKVPNLAEPIEN